MLGVRKEFGRHPAVQEAPQRQIDRWQATRCRFLAPGSSIPLRIFLETVQRVRAAGWAAVHEPGIQRRCDHSAVLRLLRVVLIPIRWVIVHRRLREPANRARFHRLTDLERLPFDPDQLTNLIRDQRG